MKRILVAAAFSMFMMLGILTPLSVSAQPAQPAQPNIEGSLDCGAQFNFSSDSCEPADGSTDDAASSRINSIVTTIINIISVVVGVIAVIMIIISGLKYVTSGGDSGKVTSAKDTIIYAIVGLVVVALAQIIVQFVLERAAPASTEDNEDTGYVLRIG